MSRSADYTISGFIYQFNKTLLELLNADDDAEISVEGIIEDIEIAKANQIEAIQCKYHEAKEKFTLSSIYKPVLQMLEHFHENSSLDINYKIFAHFPSEKNGSIKQLTKTDILTIFTSTNQKLQKYISKLNNVVDIEQFLERFSIEFGPSIEELITDVHQALEINGVQVDDIDILIYPNAIQMIAEISTLHLPSQRIIQKSQFIRNLDSIKKTAISRWTRALKTFDKILKQRRKQLQTNLNKNSRLRYFFISESEIEEFEDCIVNFIAEYLEKYHYKILHEKIPLFCLDCSPAVFTNIRIRLHKKGIKFNDGLVTDQFFDKTKFLAEPVRAQIGKSIQLEFSVRLLHYNGSMEILNEIKCHDFFLISNNDLPTLEYQDINVEKIGLNKIQEIKFILGMGETYE